MGEKLSPDDYIKGKLQELARQIDDRIPDKHGFVLLVFSFGPGGTMQYAANAGRLHVVQAMREFIALNTERMYGTDIADDVGKERFEPWWREFQKRQDPRRASYGIDLKEACYDAYMAGLAERESK